MLLGLIHSQCLQYEKYKVFSYFYLEVPKSQSALIIIVLILFLSLILHSNYIKFTKCRYDCGARGFVCHSNGNHKKK